MPKTSALLRVFSAAIFSLATTLTFAAPTSGVDIPEPTNARYPGTLKLEVDVADTGRKIHKARPPQPHRFRQGGGVANHVAQYGSKD